MPLSFRPVAMVLMPLLAAPLALLPVASTFAQAGQSPGYRFLQAVKDEKSQEVQDLLGEPGSTVINAQEQSTGEGALHIVVKRKDPVYLRYLLQKGADANIRDNRGTTPMMMAAESGQAELIDILIAAKANPNIGNSRGETPLIRAVQRRDIELARTLLNAGADPDQVDLLAGMSARDYAREDTRSPALAKLLADAPKKERRAVSGPRL